MKKRHENFKSESDRPMHASPKSGSARGEQPSTKNDPNRSAFEPSLSRNGAALTKSPSETKQSSPDKGKRV